MDSSKKKGEGRLGFVDIFILGKDIKRNYINLELKYISLTGLTFQKS
jgi:hypothetical protein